MLKCGYNTSRMCPPEEKKVQRKPLQQDAKRINPRTYKQTHTPTVVQEGGGGAGFAGTPPLSFRWVKIL